MCTMKKKLQKVITVILDGFNRRIRQLEECNSFDEVCISVQKLHYLKGLVFQK